MALHFYMNGTTGAQDGTEISNGDLSNPLLFDGFYVASGVDVSKTKTIYIRADAGETWKTVLVVLVSNDSKNYQFTISGSQAARIGDQTYPHFSCNFFPTITDTNVSMTVTAIVNGSKTDTPDTKVKLMIISGVKV